MATQYSFSDPSPLDQRDMPSKDTAHLADDVDSDYSFGDPDKRWSSFLLI